MGLSLLVGFGPFFVKLFFSFYSADVGCQVDLRTVMNTGSTNNWQAQHVVNAPELGNQSPPYELYHKVRDHDIVKLN